MTAKDFSDSPHDRRCMRDHIRDSLLQRILDGHYAAGQRLVELNLAREFQVSQAPVREALRELEAMGWIESERYCGSRVRAINHRELAETYELRAILEQRAAERTTPCPPEMLDALRATVEQMNRHADNNDPAAYAREAFRFHHLIMIQSGNSTFLRIWNNLHIEARVHYAAQQAGNALPAYARMHVEILHDLEAGNGAAAGQKIFALLDGLRERLCSDSPDAECDKAGPHRFSA